MSDESIANKEEKIEKRQELECGKRGEPKKLKSTNLEMMALLEIPPVPKQMSSEARGSQGKPVTALRDQFVGPDLFMFAWL